MARLLVHVEGSTEEVFVNDVLREHLIARGYHSVSARMPGNARLRRQRGGIRGWPSVRRDIANHLKEDPACIATTMVDYYGLPQQGDEAWPGRAEAARNQTGRKAACVEDAVLKDMTSAMGRHFNPRRFVPFVVMHEFEGLLFSDCAAFSRGIYRPDLESEFRKTRDQFQTKKSTIRQTTRPPSASRLSCPDMRNRFSATSRCWRSGWPASGPSVPTSTAG